MHALPLRLRGQAIGTLNLFHAAPGPLPAADLALGQALADIADDRHLAGTRDPPGEVLSEQLQAALNSRVIIEQAKGVLAQRGNLTMQVAFERLRRYARGHNLRLTEVARQIVETDLAADVLTAPAAPKPAARRP